MNDDLLKQQINLEVIQQRPEQFLIILTQFEQILGDNPEITKQNPYQLLEILHQIQEIFGNNPAAQQNPDQFGKFLVQIQQVICSISEKVNQSSAQLRDIAKKFQQILYNDLAAQQNPDQLGEILAEIQQIQTTIVDIFERIQLNPDPFKEILNQFLKILVNNLEIIKQKPKQFLKILHQIQQILGNNLAAQQNPEQFLKILRVIKQNLGNLDVKQIQQSAEEFLKILNRFQQILGNNLAAIQQNLKQVGEILHQIQGILEQSDFVEEILQYKPVIFLEILNRIQKIVSQIYKPIELPTTPPLPPITPPSAVASFRRSYPIDFSLYDGEQQNVLYINDNPTDQNLKIEILNTSQQNIELDALDKTPNANSHHFELRFRPGTLSTASLPQIALADGSNWHMSCLQNNSTGTVSLYFSNKTRQTITSGGKIDLTLKGVGADPSGGARGTRVELKYRNLKYQGSPNSFNGSRVEHISIVAHRGRKNIPLHVGFVGSNTILNDGSSPSELTLRITNTLKRNPSNPASSNIMFSKDTSAPSKFIISFDSGDENEGWALGTDSQVNSIKVEVKFSKDSQWIEINNSNVGSSTEWTIDISKSLPQLDASQFIQIKLSEIVTGHFSGHTNVYVHYENISGYWDGQFVCTIEKCPLLYRGGNVGIGIAANKLGAKLDIRVKQDDNFTKALRVGKGNSSHYLTVLNDGNVGIGMTNPREKLEVFGNIKSSGLSVTGNVSIGEKLEVDGNIKSSGLSVTGNVGIGKENPSEKLEVDGNIKSSGLSVTGKVGIGKENPSEKLEVDGNIKSSGLSVTGNVGIGKENPSEKLEVDGNIKSSGLSVTGKVGIGVPEPAEKLHIKDGNLRIDNGEIQSWGPIIFKPDVDANGDAIIEFYKSKKENAQVKFEKTMTIDKDGNVTIEGNLTVKGIVEIEKGLYMPATGMKDESGGTDKYVYVNSTTGKFVRK